MPPCGHLTNNLMLLSVSSRVSQPPDNSLQPIFSISGNTIFASWEKTDMKGKCHLTRLCRRAVGATRARLSADCNPLIYLTIGVRMASQLYRYAKISGLHSKQLPTKSAVKLKYSSLISLSQRKTICHFFFKTNYGKIDQAWLQPQSAGSLS